jgi:anti-sigma regulatory factor (Ser/Thr protein kinase)
MTPMIDMPPATLLILPSLFLQRPAKPEQARAVRHAVSDYLQGLGWPLDPIQAVTLAAGEAINNAVSYGAKLPGAEVSVCCRLTAPDTLTIEVRNPGTGFQPEIDEISTLPDDMAEHGRGFALMSLLMDEVNVFAEDDETVVRLVKRLAA